jgi:predicted membrane protein
MAEIKEQDTERWPSNRRHSRFPGGLLLLLAGGFLLAREFGLALPDWLFTWPMILIIVGLFIGLKHGFRNPAWLILLFIGSVFLTDQMLPGINLRPFILPVILIGLGLAFMLRPRRHAWHQCHNSRSNAMRHLRTDNNVEEEAYVADRSDFIDTTSVFGGIKKIVLSKNFQGGEITNIMGGSEINLSQADFKGRICIDTTNVFGGTKLIIPPHWDVQSEVVAIFGGIDDKRQLNGTPLDPDKVIVIDGTCLFGGIEIRSY